MRTRRVQRKCAGKGCVIARLTEEAQRLRAGLRPPTTINAFTDGGVTDSELQFFPPVPSGSPEEERRDQDAEPNLAFAAAHYPPAGRSVALTAIATLFSTNELLELLLQDAYKRSPKSRRARISLGLWLVRSPDLWPAGHPHAADADRVKRGRKLLEGILKDLPNYEPAYAPYARTFPQLGLTRVRRTRALQGELGSPTVACQRLCNPTPGGRNKQTPHQQPS